MSQIAEAYVRVRPDTTGFKQDVSRQVSRDLRGVESQMRRNNREMDRFVRGALVGTGALRQLGRAAAFASTSFIGGAGLVYAITSSIKAAMEAQAAVAQTEGVVERAGVSWRRYGKQIQAAALEQSQLSGIDDERFLRTFSLLFRATGDVNRALEDNALAANIARGANLELEQAAKIVARAEAGQARGLAQLGVVLDKGAGRLEIRAALLRKFTGETERFANTAAGAQARFNVAINETQEAIGTALLPVVTEYLNKGAEWLNQTENQEKIQRTTTRIVDTSVTVIDALAASIGIAADAWGKFNTVVEKTPGGGGKGGWFDRLVTGDITEWVGLLREQVQLLEKDMDDLFGKYYPYLGGVGPDQFFNTDPFGTFAAFMAEASKNGGVGALLSEGIGRQGREGGGRQRSRLATRDEATLTELARAQASGNRRAIEAAVAARQAFINDTIAFANKLLYEGRGDTGKLQSTLQSLHAQTESLNAITQGYIDADEQARQDRIKAAEAAAAQWREDNHQYHLAIEAMLKQGKTFHDNFKRQVAEEAAAQKTRLEMRETIQGQVLQNKLALAELKGDTDAGIKAQRAVLRQIIDYYRDLAKHTHYSRLERLRFQAQAISAQKAFNDLGNGDEKRAGGGFTLAELFAEAGEQFEQYGSNIGPAGTPLSAQDARGALAQTIKTHNVTVIQHITAPTPISQAMIDARNAARVLQ